MAIMKVHESLLHAADAGADLSTHLFKLAKLNSSGAFVLCGNGEKAFGSIFEVAKSGGPVTVQFGGIAKVVAGGNIAAGAVVQSGASGVAVAGTTNPIGVALNAAASGEIVSVALSV